MTSFVLYYILLLTTWSKAITAQESSNAKNGVTIMASSKEYLHFILEQLSDLDDISDRTGRREFILYYRGKIAGGIYDDRLLVKKTRSALELMPAAICELPYEGAKEMLPVDLCGLHAPFQATYSSSGAMPCMSGRSYTLCVSATCRSSRIALGERPTACPSPLRRAFLPPPLCCTARAA